MGRSSWRIQPLPNMALRAIKPFGRAVDVRIYSDACTSYGALAPAAFFANPSGEFTAFPKGAAEAELPCCPRDTGGISGLETFAMVAAVVALGSQLRGKRIVISPD